MTRTNNDDEVPLISFVPEEHKPDKERISSFKVYSTPGNANTTRYDFTIFHIDGNESLGILLNHFDLVFLLTIIISENYNYTLH